MPKKCRACGGRYAPTLPDGMRYFHVCPPARKLRVRLLDGTEAIVDPPLVAGLTLLEELDLKRPGHRNENVKGGPGAEASDMQAPGAGADDVS